MKMYSESVWSASEQKAAVNVLCILLQAHAADISKLDSLVASVMVFHKGTWQSSSAVQPAGGNNEQNHFELP
jgi:hypothetical protein